MKIFDKAQWHIDAGESILKVITRFQAVYTFLNEKGLLSDDGKEILELGIDSSISLNERMVTEDGCEFLGKFYDEVIDYSADLIALELEKRFALFTQNS